MPGFRRIPETPIVPNRLPTRALLGALALLLALSGCRQSREAFADSTLEPAAIRLPAHAAADAPDTAAPAFVARPEALPLPEDFPDDVYLPAGYRIDSLLDRGSLRVVSLRAPGRVPALFDAARSRMGERGWKQTLAMRDAGDSAMLSYEKADRVAVLSFNGARDADAVTVNVQLRGGAD